MNERMKILQMLSDGKITPEQAESLLNALEGDESKRNFRILNRPALDDLRSLGAQISATVTQSLSEARRALEGQMDIFSLASPSVAVTEDVALPLNIQRLTAQTTNGAVQVFQYDEPYVRIHVRGQAKTHSMNDAKRALAAAIQTEEREDAYHLTIIHGERDADKGAQLIGAHLDIYVPKTFKELYLRTHNGRMSVDSVSCDDLRLETVNGSVSLYRTQAERIHVQAENGGIELVDSVTNRCRNLSAQTKNGSITLDRLDERVRVAGRARTSLGRIQVSHPSVVATFDDENKRTVAYLEPVGRDDGENATAETRVHLETRNGSIRIK
ncbi:MAG: DUF4097 family beta strand repeat-containing protein [Alicyclobacillus sp.]|nr:DUF4097 family beta strand repeat-containing protein [Alicyclobacillus sp.]